MAGTAGTIAMEALGRASGCYNNPDDAPGFEPGPTVGQGCRKVAPGGLMNLYLYTEQNPDGFYITPTIEVVSFEPHPEREGSILTWKLEDGSLRDIWYKTWVEPIWRTALLDDSVCEEPAPGPQYPDHQPGDPIAPPYEFYDDETQCAWKVTALDSYLNSAGEPVFYWRATSNNPAVCGGPYYWWGNGQEPNVPSFEDPRGPDVPPRPPTLPPGPGQDVNDRLDKIEELIEQLKECACPETPVIEGEYRTISFRSDETSPYGKSRLRKRFKYRSQSGLDLGAVVDHWRDFTWQAGPITVSHFGSALGAPQVWAASIDEGKRVIRHAGREAGIDPDQVGKWGIGGSDNARYGVSDTMRVDTTGGYYWITARDGSNGRPIVARV